MTEQHDQKPGFGWGITVAASLTVAAALGFVCGYQSHAGLIKADIDDFGKMKVQDHIYRVELIRAPYTPETFTMSDRKAAEEDDS